MKQLRNILTPLVLFCLLAAGFPVFAQEQEEAAPKMQDEMTSKEEKENRYGSHGSLYCRSLGVLYGVFLGI